MIKILSAIDDPRQPSLTFKYPLTSILFMTLVTVICGATDWAKIVVMSQGMTDWLAQYVDMSAGVPCERTFINVFNIIKSEALEEALQKLAELIRERIPHEVICFDGQTSRGTAEKRKDLSGIHLMKRAVPVMKRAVPAILRFGELCKGLHNSPWGKEVRPIELPIVILDGAKRIQEIAEKYASYENFFFIGRQYMYPASLEGALKLKEISYINAVGYPAGEMKHEPIALISPSCPTVVLCANEKTFEKIKSNLLEVKVRKDPVIAIIEEGQEEVCDIADDWIVILRTIDAFSAVTTTVVTQLLAYYIALKRGAEIDQPRNLAKSVTVE